MEKVILNELHYSACRGCNACHKTGECIVKDDALILFDEIMACDCVAVASPIYSMGITAELKGLIDRTQFIWARKFILKTQFFPDEQIKRHKGIFISTAGLSWDNVFDGAFPIITAFFNTIGIQYYDNIIANDMDKYQGIRGHPTALKEAFEKGEKVVRVIETLKGTGRK
jgi:multimeric flavodoxin WrbA